MCRFINVYTCNNNKGEDKKLKRTGAWEELVGDWKDGNNAKIVLVYEILKNNKIKY